MPNGKPKAEPKTTDYECLTGINLGDDRYEAGDTIALTEQDAAPLIAREVVKAPEPEVEEEPVELFIEPQIEVEVPEVEEEVPPAVIGEDIEEES